MELRYEVRAFYDSAKRGMAFHTWNIGTHSRDLEISVAKNRKDIATVEWKAPGTDWMEA